MSLRHTLDAILAAIIAPACAVCGRMLDAPLEGPVCRSCWETIVPRRSGFALPFIARGQAIGPYEDALRRVLHALKYDGRRSIAPRLSALMATAGRDILSGADLVVPVPLHRRRQRERGFNQAEELARHLPIPMRRALRRVRPTRPQIDLPAGARRDNVRDAFALHRDIGRGSVVILVDDVATTGATLEACARVLTSAGAAEVRALTAARVATGPWPSLPR